MDEDYKKLLFRIQLEELITARAAMQVANHERQSAGQLPIYREDSFVKLTKKLQDLAARVNDERNK